MTQQPVDDGSGNAAASQEEALDPIVRDLFDIIRHLLPSSGQSSEQPSTSQDAAQPTVPLQQRRSGLIILGIGFQYMAAGLFGFAASLFSSGVSSADSLSDSVPLLQVVIIITALLGSFILLLLGVFFQYFLSPRG